MNFQELSPTSRTWIYQSNRELSPIEVEQIQTAGDKFLSNWATHGKALHAALKVFHNRFIVLAADEAQVKASGCSIDASVHFMKEIEKAFGLDLFDRMQITYRTNEGVEQKHAHDFRKSIESAELSEETIIFNNLVSTKAEMEAKWEIPVKDSWLMQTI